MEAIFNTDTSFFIVSIKDIADKTKANISSDVISLEIGEDVGEMIRGTIKIFDPEYQYSEILKSGMRFILTWGFKTRNQNTSELEMSLKNPGELKGGGQRRGIECIVIKPSWTLTNDGRKIYNATFYGYEFMEDISSAKVYQVGTREKVIKEVFTSLSVNVALSTINFRRGQETLGSDNYVRQNETNFKLLLRLAYEWGCIFKLGYNQAGILIGVFIDKILIGSPILQNFIQQVGGGIGNNKLIEYGVGSTLGNVFNASIQRHIGESGQGDNINLQIINGKTVVTRYVAEGKTVKVLRLNEDKLQTFLNKHLDQSDKLVSQIYHAEKLDDEILGKKIRTFFDEIDSMTAPQGLGWTINLEMIGDPHVTPLLEMKFGNGFPPNLDSTEGAVNRYYIKSVSHNLSEAGYRISIVVGDSIIVHGGFVSL